MVKRYINIGLLDDFTWFPVLGIVGPRQSGKTTLAKSLARILSADTLYLDLENPRDLQVLQNPVPFLQKNSHKLIILDEIQRMPELFPLLRSMVDEDRRAGRFIVLGSASPELIRDSSESLAGRIAYTELHPFSNEEVAEEKNKHLHWFRGGFPDAFLAPSHRLHQRWMQNFIRTYLERDIPLLGLQADPGLVHKLWTMLAHSHGNVINWSNLAKSLDLTSPTVKRYTRFLDDSFLIRLLPPYFTNIKKRLVKSPKIYVRDSGILHYLLGIHKTDTLDNHPLLGNSWEGYVIEQISLLTKQDLSFYRTQNGAECDLVLQDGARTTAAIEIKYSQAPKLSRGNRQAFQDIQAEKNYIIIPGKDEYELEEGISICGLERFLKKIQEND
jgi:predicted AAA+ superfamily ATPase